MPLDFPANPAPVRSPNANAKSPLAWLGGKSKLASAIIAHMPEHQTYVEVFAGAAWVLFTKPESKIEIINDINSELTTLYRCIKHHLQALCEQFRWMLISRDQWDDFMATPPDTLTDIQRSARFYYLAKMAYGARVNKPSFGIAATGGPRLNLLRIEEDLSEAHIRLSRVYVENRPYANIIDRFDKPATFFYIDPPYWGNETDYGKGLFERADFERLAAQLDKVKGKFLLSLNDKPEVRDTFANFHIKEVKTRYSVAAKSNKEVGELLIYNYRKK